MIPYIDAQLRRWSLWLASGRTRLGYPTRAAFVQVVGGGARASLPDDDAMAVCHAVAALEPRLRDTVDCFYRSMRSCTAHEMAKHLGCSRDTVYERIDRAHTLILGYLNDIAAGIAVPPWSPGTDVCTAEKTPAEKIS